MYLQMSIRFYLYLQSGYLHVVTVVNRIILVKFLIDSVHTIMEGTEKFVTMQSFRDTKYPLYTLHPFYTLHLSYSLVTTFTHLTHSSLLSPSSPTHSTYFTHITLITPLFPSLQSLLHSPSFTYFTQFTYSRQWGNQTQLQHNQFFWLMVYILKLGKIDVLSK